MTEESLLLLNSNSNIRHCYHNHIQPLNINMNTKYLPPYVYKYLQNKSYFDTILTNTHLGKFIRRQFKVPITLSSLILLTTLAYYVPLAVPQEALFLYFFPKMSGYLKKGIFRSMDLFSYPYNLTISNIHNPTHRQIRYISFFV